MNAGNGSLGRKLGAAAIVMAGFCFMTVMYAIAMQGKKPGLEGDYIGYWASGRQLIHHANPFDADALLRLETSAGYNRAAPSITPSPPVTFLLLLPIGMLQAWPGLIAWGMAMTVAIATSIWMLWQRNGKPDTLLPLLGFVYAPAWVCIFGGQIGVFFLVSITAFLYFAERRPLLAGALLLPCTMKPHLFLAFALVLLIWSIDRRVWRVPAGLALALAASTAVTLALDPHVFTHYLQSLHDTSVGSRATPALPMLLRTAIAPGAAWLEFAPMVLACAWAAWYYTRRRALWSWMREGLLVLIVARLCAPYAWFTDDAILLPAVMTMLLAPAQRKRALWPIALIAAIELAQVYARADMKTFAYSWTAPAWLACWLYMMRGGAKPGTNIPSGAR